MEPDCAPVRLPSIYVRLLSLRSEAIRGRRFTYIFSGRTSISRAFKIISDLYSASCSALKTDVSLQQFLFICGSEACLKLSLQLIKLSAGCSFSSWALEPFINLLQHWRRQQAAGLHLGTDWVRPCVRPGTVRVEKSSRWGSEPPSSLDETDEKMCFQTF